ncbi:MAG: WD40 repeat domain-containing protein [Planctomycetia bacterium]|nr:WD40 repeat domain-containing protein [Planctomycetia bacterium]
MKKRFLPRPHLPKLFTTLTAFAFINIYFRDKATTENYVTESGEENPVLPALHDTVPDVSEDVMRKKQPIRYERLQAYRAAEEVEPESEDFLEDETGLCCAFFSPDGKRFVTGGMEPDFPIRVRESATGAFLKTLLGHTSYVDVVRYRKDGRTLVSGSWDGTLREWDAETGKELSRSIDRTPFITHWVLSQDEKYLVSTGGYGKYATIRLWDWRRKKILRVLHEHKACVWMADISPDGTRIVSASEDKTLKIWNRATGKCLNTIFTDAPQFSVQFSSDGQKLISAGMDGVVRVWNATDGKLIQEFSSTGDVLWHTAFSPDGTLVAAVGGNREDENADYTVYVWDVKTQESVLQGVGHSLSVWTVDFSPDRPTVLTASSDHTARIWEWKARKTARTSQVRVLRGGEGEGHRSSITSVCYSPDGKTLASGSEDQTIRIWNVRTGECLKVLSGHGRSVTSVCYSPDGKKIASGSRDTSIRIWDVTTGECLKTLSGHVDGITSVCYSPDGKTIASGSWDGRIRIWNARTGKCQKRLEGHETEVYCVCYSPDGKTLASRSEDKTIRIWDATTGACLKTLEGYGSTPICYSPDGKTLATGGENGIYLWNLSE